MESKISALKADAIQAGDDGIVEMIDTCRAELNSCLLMDYDTADTVDSSDLGCDTTQYVEGLYESIRCGNEPGVIKINGRRVYAA
jgi:hypothetical protein